MAILKIRDADGNVQEIQVIKGKDGKDGANGKDYVLTDADKQEIANLVELKDYYTKEELTTETWTFTLEDGSTVNKTVVLL
jgi:hypothetical protein